jgi:hypothetical protein
MSDESYKDPVDDNEETTASVDGFGTPDSEEETVAGDASILGSLGDEEPTADGSESAAAEESLAEDANTKLCVYCISEIDAMATRCNRCSGYLPPAEGSDFKQHWTLLFCCVAIFIACIWLPIEGRRNDLYASHSIAGGFLAIFAGYGIFASWVNLFHRKMIVWPALFMALDGLFVAIRRLIQLINNVSAMENPTKEDWVRIGGPGLWVILFCSLLVFWTFLKGAAAGAKKDKERKEAARAARKR